MKPKVMILIPKKRTMARAIPNEVFHRDFLGAHRYTTGGGTARPAGGVLPSYKTKQTDEAGNAIYKDICNPITKDFRTNLIGWLYL